MTSGPASDTPIIWTELARGVHTCTVPGPEPTTATLVVGTEAAALIDPGRNATDAATVRNAVGEVTDAPLTHVVVTGATHTGSLAAFEDLTTLGQWSLTEDTQDHPAPNRPFAGAASVSLGDLWLEVVQVGGRCESDAVVAVPAAHLVVVGDLVDSRDDALEGLTAADVAEGWPDGVHTVLGLLRPARGQQPADRVICSRGPVTDAAGVTRFGMAIDELSHADDPAPTDPGGRPQLPITFR